MSISNFNGAVGWCSNFIPHFIRHVITYICLDLSWTVLAKGTPGQNRASVHIPNETCVNVYIITLWIINDWIINTSTYFVWFLVSSLPACPIIITCCTTIETNITLLAGRIVSVLKITLDCNKYTCILASIHWADGRLTTRSREASKPCDSSIDFFNYSEIWQASQKQRCRRCPSYLRAIRSLYQISRLQDLAVRCLTAQ